MIGSSTTQLTAIDFDQDIEELSINFTGRKWVFQYLDQWFQQDNQRFLILAGEPGVGKSAIAAHLIQHHRNNVVAYHFCQLGNEKTVRPGGVLRSLAAQLDKSFPHYSEALFNTIRSTLSGEVHIHIDKIETLEDEIRSIVKRFKINNVNMSDIINELDILIRAPLAALPKLYQEKGGEIPELAIILIDGLDVAVTMEAGVQEDEDLATLFAALSEDESLPTWIRFLFTTRLDRRVLREFEPLEPYFLNEKSEKNLTEIHQYVEYRLSSPMLQQQVVLTSIDTQVWIEQLTQQSQGNFRYIKSLLDDLEAGYYSLNTLPTLPQSIERAYTEDFTQRFPKKEWNDRYTLILTTLAEAEHPLTEDELEILTTIRPRQLRQDLWGLRQFLNVDVVGDDSWETFTIFHHSLKEHLLRNVRVTHSSTTKQLSVSQDSFGGWRK